MLISTRGRYALRVLLDLAQHGDDTRYVPLKDIAKRQNISLKYLEQIMPVLSRTGMIEGVQGKGGGYRLSVLPENCKIGDVLRATEGDLAPVACLARDAEPCARTATCRTYPLWNEFYQLVNDFFDHKTLADILE